MAGKKYIPRVYLIRHGETDWSLNGELVLSVGISGFVHAMFFVCFAVLFVRFVNV